jgi:uncharacterized protein (DUF2126 family)
LVIEVIDGRLHVFLPPLLQAPFLRLAEQLMKALHRARLAAPLFAGYIPGDELNQWEKLGLTADPGVLEINLPPCATWQEYDRWISALEVSATAAGLRSYKESLAMIAMARRGKSSALWRPSLDENPLFLNPSWITSILRTGNITLPLLCFTGSYVGPSSQARGPMNARVRSMTWRWRISSSKSSHRRSRGLISETLRHLIPTVGQYPPERGQLRQVWNINSMVAAAV